MQKYKTEDKVFRLSGYSFLSWHLKQPLYAFAKNTFMAAAISCLVHGASAEAQTYESSTPKVTGVLSESVRLALFNHPEISEANARVCQAIHRLGLGRALRRPQVSLTVSGGQQIFDRIRKDEPISYIRKPRSFTRTPVYERTEKDRKAAARHRQYDHH